MLASTLQGKPLANNNIPAIRSFFIKLGNIHQLAKETNRAVDFDRKAVHDEILAKVPQWKSKWVERRAKMEVEEMNALTFAKLMEFLRQRLRVLEESTPLAASFTKVSETSTSGSGAKTDEETAATNSSSSRRSRGKRWSPRRASSPVSTSAKESTSVKEVRGDPEPCVVCAQTHFVENCQQFKSLSAADRADISRKSGLCFTCLERGHTSRSCASKRRCGSCKEKHHGLLHEWLATTPIGARLQTNAAI